VRVAEEDFYASFADWLKNELDEVTVAIALGGAGMQKKWGTPDVIGVYKALASHRIKFDLEIISAEIKVDPQQPVVAFGQAAAYRLFSAKSYIVMPTSISEEDYSRLEALCMLFGIGLVLFETNPEEPDFKIRVRAQRYPPDMFYVNEFAERIYQIDPATISSSDNVIGCHCWLVQQCENAERPMNERRHGTAETKDHQAFRRAGPRP
jgi:hypothetical protein